jgi:hypothetical protein
MTSWVNKVTAFPKYAENLNWWMSFTTITAKPKTDLPHGSMHAKYSTASWWQEPSHHSSTLVATNLSWLMCETTEACFWTSIQMHYLEPKRQHLHSTCHAGSYLPIPTTSESMLKLNMNIKKSTIISTESCTFN